MKPMPKSRILKKLHSLFYAYSHMKEVIELCHHMEDLISVGKLTDGLNHTLFTGLLCTYARSFGQNDGLAALDRKFSNFEDPFAQATHDSVISTRDRLYAHTDLVKNGGGLREGDERKNLQRIFLAIDLSGLITWQTWRTTTDPGSLGKIVRVCEIQSRRMRGEIDDLVTMYLGTTETRAGQYLMGNTLIPMPNGLPSPEMYK